jgi:hypothetical protein
MARRERFEPPTARSVAWCSASIWSAPDRSGLLTSEASSIQTDREGTHRIVWMIKRMIRAPTQLAAEGPRCGAPRAWVSTIRLPRPRLSAANWSAGLSGRPATPPHREMGPPRPKTPRPELRRGEVTGGRPDTPGSRRRWRRVGRSKDGRLNGLLVLAPGFGTKDLGRTQAGRS